MRVDVLIVGQGLAGSLLAWSLLRRQQSVLVVDDGTFNASQVAAGLINPVSGQRLVKVDGVETLLKSARTMYELLAEQFAEPFYFQLPMLRLLQTAEQRSAAEKRLQQPDYQNYLGGLFQDFEGLQADHGVLQQWQTGYLATKPLLRFLRQYLIEQNAYRPAMFDYHELHIEGECRWREVIARQVVFCEGYKIGQNPWFGGLPMQSAQGEILTCSSEGECPLQIINGGHWLIPLSGQRFRVGATFTPGRFDGKPSADARATLLKSALTLFPDLHQLKVEGQEVGIRPATLDKKPLIGCHPQYSQLNVFNGFGSKGSLSIPWHAERMALTLTGKIAQIPASSDVSRYHDTHFPG